MTSQDLVLVQSAETVAALLSQWHELESAIQPEARGPYIDSARRALDAGLWDAAVGYFWSATIAHLREKVMAYGLEYFAAQLAQPGLDCKEKLERDVSDYALIDGCYRLGLIGRHAHIQLQHCREIRNHFALSSHPSEETVDPLESLNFIKNCVKFCLAVETPAPGLNPKVLIENLRETDVTDRADEIRVVLQRQSSKLLDTLIQIFFSEYITPDCPGTLKANINAIAPFCWEGCSQECRLSLGLRYAKLVGEGSEEELQEAVRFLRRVGGTEKIPVQLRKSLVTRACKNLIEAHFGTNNFYTEPGHAEALADLGPSIPDGTEEIYVKALVLSYVGNSYGVSWAAEPHVAKMLRDLKQRCVNILFAVIERDDDIIRELSYDKPVRRLKKLCELVAGLNIPTRAKPRMAYFLAADEAGLTRHFARLSRRT
jgi:hypothetical protein